MRRNDYFQQVLKGSGTQEKNLIDPTRDPAITIAEVCSMIPDGIPPTDLGAVIAILSAEDLLFSGKFIDDFSIHDNSVQIRATGSLYGNRTGWVYIDSQMRRFNVKISQEGRFMLKAKRINPSAGARKRAKELLSLTKEQLQATAWKALANKVLSQK